MESHVTEAWLFQEYSKIFLYQPPAASSVIPRIDSWNTVPKTNSKFAPENRPKRPKRKESSSNHQCSGFENVSLRVLNMT